MSDTNPVAKTAKYCVCVDQREESLVAMRLACLKARASGGSVDLLHVVLPADFQTLGAIADRMREERKAEGLQLLQRLAMEANTAYGISPGLILREGAVGDEIIDTVTADPDISALVMGIAQQGGSQGRLSTWLTTQIGSKLLIPLMMIPSNLTDQQLQNLA